MRRAAAFLEGGAPHLTIVARFPLGDRGADLFIEAPDGLYVPMAKRLPESAKEKSLAWRIPPAGWSASRSI